MLTLLGAIGLVLLCGISVIASGLVVVAALQYAGRLRELEETRRFQEQMRAGGLDQPLPEEN